MGRGTAFEIADHIADIEPVEIAGGVDVAGDKPGTSRCAFTAVRRWGPALEVGDTVNNIEAVERAIAVGVADSILAAGAHGFAK